MATVRITIWSLGSAPTRRFWLNEREIEEDEWEPAPEDWDYPEGTFFSLKKVSLGMVQSVGWEVRGKRSVDTYRFVIVNTADQVRWATADDLERLPASGSATGTDQFFP